MPQVERHLGGIWEAFGGRYLGGIWEASGRPEKRLRPGCYTVVGVRLFRKSASEIRNPPGVSSLAQIALIFGKVLN